PILTTTCEVGTAMMDAHFTDVETEVLTGKVTWPKSHRDEVSLDLNAVDARTNGQARGRGGDDASRTPAGHASLDGDWNTDPHTRSLDRRYTDRGTYGYSQAPPRQAPHHLLWGKAALTWAAPGGSYPQ
ncbi:ARHGEF1 isoform 21, partial [Pan troglodytes]